jgi:hypothetical protein
MRCYGSTSNYAGYDLQMCVCVCARVRACTHIQAVANSETGGGESSSHCLFCHDTGTLVFILPSIKQHSMHSLSYSRSRCLTNTLMHFSTRQCHVTVVDTQRDLVCER